MRALSKSAAAGVTAVALLGAGMSAAYADNIIVDGDGVVPATSGDLSLGTVACNATVTDSVLVAAIRKGNGDNANPVFQNGSTVAVSIKAVSGAGLSAVIGTDNTIVLPANWTSLGNNAVSSDTATSAVSLTSTTPGSSTGSVTFAATGTDSRGGSLVRSESLNVTWTTADCSTNTAPSAPGAPVASTSPSQGGFTLSWDASTDKESNAVTYTLEGKDTDDVAFTQIASGLSTTSYAFAPGSPVEGTWTYRVKAVETSTSTALSSAWSASSLPVVVDQSAPDAPTATADRDAEYSSGGSSWWKDTVTISFSSAGDKTLVDGSAGSGVASVSSPQQSFGMTGPFTATSSATDKVGLTSAVTSFTGSVDATAPVVILTCPTASVVKGSTAYASWTASDVGSGLATAASGQTAALDTSSIGSHTVTAPAGTAVDNVGHQSDAATCGYSVIYDFRGFFQPVDMTGVNAAKAGSAIPIKFSLNGYQGMDIIAAGSPTFTITGGALAGDEIEQTVSTAGASSLSYDAVSDQYVYVWKTDKALAGKSGTFSLTLNDGTEHVAKFSFRK